MSKRYLAVHNIDLAREEKRGSVAVPTTQRVKADTAVAAGDFTKEEIASLLASGAIREATPAEEEAAAKREEAATESTRQRELDVQRESLAREHAGERSTIEQKHEAAKQAELAKLEEGHAKERAKLEQELTGVPAPKK